LSGGLKAAGYVYVYRGNLPSSSRYTRRIAIGAWLARIVQLRSPGIACDASIGTPPHAAGAPAMTWTSARR
jgi:hypothetical protein